VRARFRDIDPLPGNTRCEQAYQPFIRGLHARRVPGCENPARTLLLLCHGSGTNGSLTGRYLLVSLTTIGCI
jgi:hypothetical protein